MFVLLPYQHDRMSVRRLPWVSIAILAANLLAFALTLGGAREADLREREALDAVHAFWAGNPFVKFPPAFDERYPRPVSGLRKVVGSALEPPGADDLARQQAEFDSLVAAAIAASDAGPHGRWGFVPSRPSALTLITSQFLHAGWLHLVGNLLFLALSAPFIENRWGRVLFPVFYLAGGAAAAGAQALASPGSTVPLVGASGAIAAVMGAFLVCFAATRIRFFWAWVIVGVRWGTFAAPAWLMLPLWLASQLLHANVAGSSTGVAYWAHVGGFLFGAAFAGALRLSGVEARRLLPSVEEASSAYGDARVDRAIALRDAGDFAGAAAQFAAVLAASPGSLPAREGAFTTALLMNDPATASRHALPALEGRLRAGDAVAALQRYEEIRRHLPDLPLPARLLHAVAAAEARASGAEAAIATCRLLAQLHPSDPFTLKAQLLTAKAAIADGRGDLAAGLLGDARRHPLATGEVHAEIERLAAAARGGSPRRPPGGSP